MNSVFTLQQQYDQAWGMNDITTPEMINAIDDWHKLYYNKVKTSTEDPSQRIAYTIVRKLTKTCFSEYEVTTKDEFAENVLKAMTKVKRKKAMQRALIGGVALIKPIVPTNGSTKWKFLIIPRRNIRVYGRDEDGEFTDICTSETSTQGRFFYTLLERRTLSSGGYLTIRSKLYRSNSPDLLGGPASFSEVEKYKDIPDEYTFEQPIGSIGLASLVVPIENCEDGSEDAVSVYAACAGKIHTVNENEAQLNGEFRKGEMRIIASSDLIKEDPDSGRKAIVSDVFTGIDDDPDSVGITPFAPAFRDASYLARNTEALRECESIIGLKRGLLADVQEVERTATEITSSDGDYALTIADFQEAWETCLRETLRLCGVMGQLYGVPGSKEIEEDDIAIDWGNGVLYDETEIWADMLDQVARGLLRPEKAVGWKHHMPTDTPEDEAEVRRMWMPEIEELTRGLEEE